MIWEGGKNLISYKNGFINSIINEDEKLTWVEVNIDNVISKAVNYKDVTGEVNIGDKVVLNTTAVDLSLGTGGYHFIMYNHSNPSMDLKGQGHIMKLRYTPYQMKCLTAEEESSPYHHVFEDFKSLDKHIVIVATLHSMIAPISAMIKYMNKDIKINYIMTDGGALPIAFSKTVVDLKEKEILDKTITIGHAFGGDLECTNIYTGLIAAKEILKGDVTIISMGPGIVGTGTKYGFTGIEQGSIVDAVNNLGGKAVVAPRISFKDSRGRHRGLSHHSVTVLSEVSNTSSYLILPILEEDEKSDYLMKQIKESKIEDKHKLILEDGKEVSKALDKFNLQTSTMGRTINEDLEYFIALGAVGKYVAKMFN